MSNSLPFFDVRRACALAIAAALVGVSRICAAAEAADGPAATASAADDSTQLQEIVVTSTRQAEPLSKVPISVEVFTEKQMDAEGVKNFADIARLTPGLTINTPQAGSNTISIRGVSSQAGASTTGIYIDDVPIQVRQVGYAAGTQFPEVFDLERVEVLRGPQGTLFGSGSEGGTVRFLQTAPSVDSYTGYSRAEVSSTQSAAGSYEAGAAFGGPIVKDVLGFRASMFFRHDGGWLERVPESFTQNNTTGAGYGAATTAVPTGPGRTNANSQNSLAWRLALKLNATDRLSITPSFFYQKQTQADVENNFWLSGSNPGADHFTTPLFAAATPNTMLLPPGQRGYMRLEVGSVSAEWRQDSFSIYSTSAYLDQQKNQLTDQTTYYAVTAIDPSTQAYPAPGQKAQNLYYDAQRVYSQELRIQSNDSNGMFKWVGGLFYSHANQFSHQYTEDNIWGASTTFYGYPVPPDSGPFGPAYSAYDNFFGTPLLNGYGTYQADARTIEEQYAIFGQADLKLFDKLTFTAGVRVSRNKLSYALSSAGAENNLNAPYGADCPTDLYCPFDSGIFAAAFPAGEIHNTERAVTPKIGVSYQITDNDFVYASATKGFRPGGAQVQLPSGCDSDLVSYGYVDGDGKAKSPLTYKSDNVWSYEVGTKDRAFDGHLTAAASAYVIKWNNIQQQIALPFCGYALVDNLGSATIKGFDLNLAVSPLTGLNLTAAIGYTHTGLDDGLYQPGGVVVYGKGTAILNAGPPWTEVVSGEYTAPRFNDIAGYLHMDVTHSSRYARTGRTDPNAFNYDPLLMPDPPTTLVNGRLGGRWESLDVSLFCNNLFDSHPLLSLTHSSSFAYVWTATTFRSRTVGLTAAYHF